MFISFKRVFEGVMFCAECNINFCMNGSSVAKPHNVRGLTKTLTSQKPGPVFHNIIFMSIEWSVVSMCLSIRQ